MCNVTALSQSDVTVEELLIGIDALPSSNPAFLTVPTLCERYGNETSNNTKHFLTGCIIAKILATSLDDIPSAERMVDSLPSELQGIATGALHTRLCMTGVFDD